MKVWAQMSPMSDGRNPGSMRQSIVNGSMGGGTELKSITAGKDIIKGPHIMHLYIQVGRHLSL